MNSPKNAYNHINPLLLPIRKAEFMKGPEGLKALFGNFSKNSMPLQRTSIQKNP
jgi:hypothetical protein